MSARKILEQNEKENEIFKKEYTKCFKPHEVPELREFNPTTEKEKKFWYTYQKKHPGIDKCLKLCDELLILKFN